MTSATIESWLRENTAQLVSAGIDSARLDCLLLLEDELAKPREWLLARSDTKIEPSHLLILNTKVTQRTQRTPLAYVRNRQEFYGRQFYVDERVLIPRPESETIIELLLSVYNKIPCTIVDLGTGSGCLAITAKLELPEADVIATDISTEALEVTRKNAQNFNSQIKFIQADLLLPSLELKSLVSDQFIVLANLPYVPEGLITSPEITKEPAVALFSGTDGLKHYRRLWNEVTSADVKPDFLITESLESQHSSMSLLASEAGYRVEKSLDLIQLFSRK